jgi:hypothetical protein
MHRVLKQTASNCNASTIARHGLATHVVQHKAHEQVEWDPEVVDDGGAHLLWHVAGTHLHHGRPEDAHADLKHAERNHLQLALQGQAITSRLDSLCRTQVVEGG